MNPVGEAATAEDYRDFAERQSADSPCYRAWALAVSADTEVLALLDTLPPAKRQPHLVLAAARWHGAGAGPYAGLRSVLLDRWDDVRATVLARATQTNEVGRCATLLPVLASLPGPLALLEVGASAGLCLFPDRYGYRYTGSVEASLDPPSGAGEVVLDCVVEGTAPVPDRLPEVVWRGGIDLHPLDVGDDDAMAWLQTLVWPEHQDRRARLAAAVRLVRPDPPALVGGDLVEQLAGLAATVPEEATMVVFHSAVLAYLSPGARARFVEMVTALRGYWVSNEGPAVLPVPGAGTPPVGSAVGVAPFLLALDGRPVAWTHGHGRAIHWLSR